MIATFFITFESKEDTNTEETTAGAQIEDFTISHSFDESQDPADVVLTDASGTITSPGYPNNYEDNVKHSWLIHLPTQGRIFINFKAFHLEDNECW